MNSTEHADPNGPGLSAGPGPACKACPFRVGARVVYDADALEALHDGCEPSCHQRVGMESIFHEYAPTENRCHGYDAWMRDEPGFAAPSGPS